MDKGYMFSKLCDRPVLIEDLGPISDELLKSMLDEEMKNDRLTGYLFLLEKRKLKNLFEFKK